MILLLAVASLLPAKELSYDPSRVSDKVETRLTSFSYEDREVPLKVYLPQGKPAPVILLSHGLLFAVHIVISLSVSVATSLHKLSKLLMSHVFLCSRLPLHMDNNL